MKTRAFLAALLALGLAGCAEDHASIEIFALCGAPKDAKVCSTTGACETLLASARPFLYTQLLGVSGVFTNHLELFTQLNNQTLSNADPTSLRVNTDDFHILEYRLSFRSALFNLDDVVFPASGTVPAATSSTPVIPYIPQSIALMLRNAMPDGTTMPVTVELRVYGRFDDGTTLETGPYEVTVDVTDAVFAGFRCEKATEVVTAVCPNDGQTASFACATP